MRARHFVSFVAGAGLAVAAAAFAQSGYPTRIIAQTLLARAPAAADLSTAPVTLSSTRPGFLFTETDGAADNRSWYAVAGSESFFLGLRNDDASVAADFLTVTRTGTTVDAIELAGKVTVNGDAQVLTLNETDGANHTSIKFDDAGANQGYIGTENAAGQLCVGTAAGDMCLRTNGGSALRVSTDDGNSSVDMTPSSGTFTATYTNACTTSPTQSIRWYKIGSVVTMTAAAATGNCTADTTTFDTDSTDVPAAIRPTTSAAYSAGFGANNNGTSVTAMIEIATNGEIIVNRCGAVTGTCDGGAWTGSGNRALDAWTISYVQ